MALKFFTLISFFMRCVSTTFLLNCVLAVKSVPDVGPASVMVGNIVQGNRLASAQGRDMGMSDDDTDAAKKVGLR